MLIIGHCRREDDGFVGRLDTLVMDAAIRLAPTGRTVGRGPDFLILKGQSQLGAAWRGSEASGAVLTGKPDDPTWPEPLNFRVMAAEDGVLPITWMRRTEERAEAKPPPPEPGG